MTDYYILITDAGAALESAAHANGTTVALASFGVCDGDVEFTPDPTLTTFANEVYNGPISSLAVSADDPAVLVAQCIIPSTSGGYTIRGIALYASDGTLYATGNYPDQQKPATDSGYSASLEIMVQLAVSDTADITLQVTDDSYLTESQADTLYLRQDKNLGEIAAAGADAQSESRGNIGLGDIATKNAADFLSSDGGEVDGDVSVTGSVTTGGIEITAPYPFIDFHYEDSDADYTSRIIEEVLGELTFVCNAKIINALKVCSYDTSGGTRATDNALIMAYDFAGLTAFAFGYYEGNFCVLSYNDDGGFNKVALTVDKLGNMNIPGDFNSDGDITSKGIVNDVSGRVYSPGNPPPAQPNTASLAANGWFKDTTTGLILQWGTAGTSSSPDTTKVTFPIAFPTACFGAQCTGTSTTDSFFANPSYNGNAISATGFTICGPGGSVSWFAVGY